MFDFEPATHEQLSEILDDTADELLRLAKWKGPNVDAVEFARSLDLVVARDRKLQGRARYVRLSTGRGRSRGAIFVGEADRPERLQWAVAHELGEFAVHRVFKRAGIPPRGDEPALREQLANELARRILLPLRPFQSAGRDCNWDLTELKRTFPAASHELIARRTLDLPPPVVITVIDHGRVHWRRGNRPFLSAELCSRERRLAQGAHESGAYQQQEADDLFIRAWPVHEPGWKREILRTELRLNFE
jgi:hypothetical protein